MEAKDKDGWPIVSGARVAAERGYALTRSRPVERHEAACLELEKQYAERGWPHLCRCPRPTEKYWPTDEYVVLGLSPHRVHDVVVELRSTESLGRFTRKPSACRVLRGDSKKSAAYRELTDPSYRKARKARKETA